MVAVSLPLFVQAEATENGHAVIDPTLRYQKLEGWGSFPLLVGCPGRKLGREESGRDRRPDHVSRQTQYEHLPLQYRRR